MNVYASPAVPPQLLEFFKREANENIDTLERNVGCDDAESMATSVAAARALRGSATMARLTTLAVMFGRIEKLSRSIQAGRLTWSGPMIDLMHAALADARRLANAADNWTDAEESVANARTRELTLQGTPIRAMSAADPVVPIGRLFHDDGGPHVIYVAVTPQTQFEQQLVALASRQTPATPAFALEPAVDLHADRRTPSAAARALAWRPPEQPAPRPPQQTAPRPTEQPAPPPPEPAPPADAAARGQRSTAPRGDELRALLQQSVNTLSASFSGRGDEIVPIDALVYRGAAALDRARRISAVLRERGAPVAPDDFAELLDLIELAGRG